MDHTISKHKSDANPQPTTNLTGGEGGGWCREWGAEGITLIIDWLKRSFVTLAKNNFLL